MAPRVSGWSSKELLKEDVAVQKGDALLRRVRAEAAPILEALRSGDITWSDLAPADRRRIRGVPLIDWLLERSFELRFDDPRRMLRLAKLAKKLTESLSTRRYGRKVVADLLGRAWADLGNAYRVADDFTRAEDAFLQATVWIGAGTQDPRLTARVSDLLASLYADQRRFGEALELLVFVQSAYERLGEDELAGRAAIKRGIFVGSDNRPEEAVILLLSGLKRIVREKDPQLESVAVHNLLWYLVEAGLSGEARAILARYRYVYRRNRDHLNKLRLRWLEARISFGLEEFEQAETGFHITRLAFKKAEQIFDSSLVSLDLALLYARQNRRIELQRLTAELVATFRSYGIAREALASLVLLQKSCAQERVAREQLVGQVQAITAMVAQLERGAGLLPRSSN